MERDVAVLGLGYVGCVTAACLSRDGFRVIGVDVAEDKVEAVNSGRSPIVEPGLEELVAAQVTEGRLRATTDLREALSQSQIVLVAVGTPSAADGSVEAGAVVRVMESIGQVLSETNAECLIVVRSTLLPGILEDQLIPALQQALGEELGGRVKLANHPEFLRETTAIQDYDDPPFLLAGAEDESAAEAIFELYPNVTAKRIATDLRTAALVKYACNAFHALKIVFANEIGVLAHAFGADGQRVMEIVCEDDRLNISPAYLRPGFAFGGSCLPKDVRALNRYGQQSAVDTPVLNAILPSNEIHIDRAIRRVREFPTKRVGLVGLSFKAGTDDLRESPQVRLAESLLGQGYDLKIFDPSVRVSRLIGTNLSYVDAHLPHLAGLLVDEVAEIYSHSELLIVCTNVAKEWEHQYGGDVLDLRRDLTCAANESVGASSL